MFRIGQGFDVHPLVENRPLILGGVKVPFARGLAGHSNADVLTHAVIDAWLGALATGDIGQWFPDSNIAYKDADSLSLLTKVVQDPIFKRWQLANLDCTIIAEEPKLSTFFPRMRENYAKIFNCSRKQISVKATTTEKLGFCGRGEGIAAMAVILIQPKK
jgi:2-C-methyl-D-erythritol 2,4-cyclodiphosphate synthase